MDHGNLFVLGHPVTSLTTWILCRTSGDNMGPAYLDSAEEASHLRANLIERAKNFEQDENVEFLSELVIYRAKKDLCDGWNSMIMWHNCHPDDLEKVEFEPVKAEVVQLYQSSSGA